MASTESSISGATIARRLASCNKTARDGAVRALSSWLPHQPSSAVSDTDLAKIWKGLFYCVWHADKLPAQLDLANRLASLLPGVADAILASRYFEAFLLTIRREWGGIDFLRLDKFYLLIRRFLRHVFLLLKKHAWDLDLTERLIQILSEKSLLFADKHPANGVNYHIAEAFLDELKEFLPLTVETLELMLKPFISVLEKSADKVLLNKVKVNVFDRLLEHGGLLLRVEKAGEQVESGSDVEKFGKVALVMGLSKKLFGAASAAETLQGNRKILFGLSGSFLKLEKDIAKSGLNVSVQHLENGNLEKVDNTIVPENCDQIKEEKTDKNVGSDDKPIKKRKKSKKTSDGVGSDDKPTKRKKLKNTSEDMEKKSKSKKKQTLDLTDVGNTVKTLKETSNIDDVVSSNVDAIETQNLVTFDEHVIGNLQRQFEKVAAEAGMENDSERSSYLPATPVVSAGKKKKKKTKSEERKVSESGSSSNEENSARKSVEKSVKKVRFSIKNNLVWKPNNPLPPQSLRLPPSATPRGSALKKGVLPGPIRESPPTIKKIKVKASSLKRSRKGAKIPSSAVKRLRKLQSLSV